MDRISAIRCTVNPASITESDLLDTAAELWEDSDGAGHDKQSLAETLTLRPDHPAITERVLAAVNRRVPLQIVQDQPPVNQYVIVVSSGVDPFRD